MPDFAALKEAGAAPQGVNFAGSDDPYNLPEYMARDYGLTAEQCAAPPAPTEDTLRNQGFTMRQYGDGPQEWTSPAKAGTTPLTFSMADPAAMAQRPPGQPEPRIETGSNGDPRAVGQPSPEAQMNEVITKTASVVTAGINAAVKADFSSAAGLGGAIGDALGIPHAGEAAALASQVRDMLKPGEMGAMLSDPLAMANGLTGVLDALGIPVPPALKVAIQQAKQIADALKTAAPPGGGIPGVYAVGQFVARMGTSMTSHGTPLLPGPGALNVLCLGTPVWRAGLDFHVCPLAPPPHVGGFVPPTQLSVLALGGPIARHAADKVLEAGGGPNPIIPMTQAARDAERKRQKEEEEKKKREEAERKKREQEQRDKNDQSQKHQSGLESKEGESNEGESKSPTKASGKEFEEQIKKDLEHQKKSIDDKLEALKRWNDDDKKAFEQYFGSSDESARDDVTKKLEKMRDLNSSMSASNFKDGSASDLGDPTGYSNTFAYVYPDDKTHTVQLGPLYYTAPETGTDSRHGTLSHEMSHFSDVAGNDDVSSPVCGGTCYGKPNAEALAKSSPEDARRNADNYQYYLEHKYPK